MGPQAMPSAAPASIGGGSKKRKPPSVTNAPVTNVAPASGGLASGGAAAISSAVSAATGVATVAASPVHRLIEPQQLLDAQQSGAVDEEEDDTFDVVEHRGCEEAIFDHRHRLMTYQSGLSSRPWEDRGGLPGLRDYVPGQLLQQRLSRTFHESMEVIAVERREAFGMPFMTPGCYAGDYPVSSSASSASNLIGNRARTFAEGLRRDFPFHHHHHQQTPIPTPAGTYIGTPTWTSADSGEFAALAGRDDPSGPLYVQASPGRWAAEHCDEFSISQAGAPDRPERGVRNALPRFIEAETAVPFPGLWTQR